MSDLPEGVTSKSSYTCEGCGKTGEGLFCDSDWFSLPFGWFFLEESYPLAVVCSPACIELRRQKRR